MKKISVHDKKFEKYNTEAWALAHAQFSYCARANARASAVLFSTSRVVIYFLSCTEEEDTRYLINEYSMTAKVMFSFPDQLVARMKVAIPSRDRSKVVARLLEKEICSREEKLYQCAKELEENAGLHDEMRTWDDAFSQDGLMA